MNEEQKKLIDLAIKPELPFMPGSRPEPTPLPNPLLDGLVEWGNILDVDKLGNNSVVTIKIGSDDPIYGAKLQMAIVKQVLEPRVEKLKEKRITVLFMAKDDSIESISQEDMEKSGWVKKDKSRIITLS